MSGRITPSQVKLIHVACSALKIGKEEYRKLLDEFGAWPFAGNGNEPTCKGLTEAEADALLAELKRRGWQYMASPRGKRTLPKGVTPLPSSAQRGMIARLAGEINWKLKDGLDRYALKVIGKARPATSREASKLIEALKGLKSTQEKTA